LLGLAALARIRDGKIDGDADVTSAVRSLAVARSRVRSLVQARILAFIGISCAG
jgi:hypothetical protein